VQTIALSHRKLLATTMLLTSMFLKHKQCTESQQSLPDRKILHFQKKEKCPSPSFGMNDVDHYQNKKQIKRISSTFDWTFF